MRYFLFAHTRVWTRDFWISSPALYHCSILTSGFHLWQFQVFNSGAEGLVWYCSDCTCDRFSFCHTRVWTRDFWISSPALYHCSILTSGFHLWQFQVFNSGAEGLAVVLFCLDLWDMFFSPTLGFEPGTSGYLVLHSNTVPQWCLVFTADTFRCLTLVQRNWWWYCSDWTCDWCSVSQHQGLTGNL